MRRTAFPPATGFTLIETLVCVVIVAVLAALAYPSYLSQIERSRRADAIVALLAIQQAQEGWRANNTLYADTVAALRLPEATRHHRLSILQRSEHGYTAVATATSDHSCTTLSVTLTGGNMVYGASGPAGVSRCWNR